MNRAIQDMLAKYVAEHCYDGIPVQCSFLYRLRGLQTPLPLRIFFFVILLDSS